MPADRRDQHLDELRRMAERLDALADAAELMDDADGASRYRRQAVSCRMRGMALLDDD